MSQWQIASFVIGLLHVALPLSAWNILYRKHDPISVALWCSGSLFFGMGFMLISLRSSYPSWLSFTIAGPLAFAAYPLRCAALRREVGLPTVTRRSIAFWLTVSVAYLTAQSFIETDKWRIVASTLAHLVGAILLTSLAWRCYLRSRFRSATLLATTAGVFAVALAIRIGVQFLQGSESEVMATNFDYSIMLAAAFVAALYGNLGYIGIALETSRRKELNAAGELAREHERLLQTQLRLQEQTLLLEERDRLLVLREEMLGALAHEVRQPLNNALAALTSASHVIEHGDSDRENAVARLQRANTVLMQVNSALDNTLSDAVLLTSDGPVARQDYDLDTLLELALGDIDPEGRGRVCRERSSPTRTAAMDPGLMRLALRNVLANALAYSPASSPVVVRIADSDEPLAIVFEVLDRGPGIADDLLPRLFTRGARGHLSRGHRGHGLGLHIVRRVMELHSGVALALPRPGGGLIVRLVVPQ